MSSADEDGKLCDAKLPVIKEIMLCLESSGSRNITRDILGNATSLVRKHYDLPSSFDKIILEMFDEEDEEFHRSQIRSNLELLIPSINEVISKSQRLLSEMTTTDMVIRQLEHKGTNGISEQFVIQALTEVAVLNGKKVENQQ